MSDNFTNPIERAVESFLHDREEQIDGALEFLAENVLRIDGQSRRRGQDSEALGMSAVEASMSDYNIDKHDTYIKKLQEDQPIEPVEADDPFALKRELEISARAEAEQQAISSSEYDTGEIAA